MVEFAKVLSGLALMCVVGLVFLLFTPDDNLLRDAEINGILIRNSETEEETLKKVVLVFRHGERAPRPFAFVCNITLNSWPDGFGALTKLGKVNSHLLGKKLRRRYDRLLTPFYNKTNIIAISTEEDRTLMTAYLVLSGMYPPIGHQKWTETIQWSPIPVYIDNSLKDYFFTCQRLAYEYALNRSDQLKRNFQNLAFYLERTISCHCKYPNMPDLPVFQILDLLESLRSNGIKLEPWAKIFLDNGRPAMSECMFSFFAKTRVQRQITMNAFGKRLLNFIDSQRNVLLYSAHDHSLYSFAGALGFEIVSFPNPLATIAIELHRKNNEYFVKGFFTGGLEEQIVSINMTCGFECRLADFKNMLDYRVDNYNELCHFVPEQFEHLIKPLFFKNY